MNMLGASGGFPARGAGPTGPGPGGFNTGVNVGGRPLLAPPQSQAPTGTGLTASLPAGLSFPPGTRLQGEVTGKEKGQFLLRFGEHTLRAQAQVPLEVGQKLLVQVQGEKSGQLHLTIVPKPAQQMSHTDLSEALMHDHMPPSDENLSLAHSMVEHSVPVTRENLTFLKSVLAQVSQHAEQSGSPNQASTPNKVGATFFLQSNNIPVTPQNVLTLATFLTTNPQVGCQLMTLQTEFRKMTESPSARSTRTMELLSEVPGLLGEVVIDPNRQASQKKTAKRLKDLARDMGIEARLGPGGGAEEEDWTLAMALRHIRQGLAKDPEAAHLSRALSMIQELEENLQAHTLINQARTHELYGYFYLQVPLPLVAGDTAEVWIRYRQEEDGSRTVDSQDAKLEFLVCTEHLGELTFVVELFGGSAMVDVGTPSEEVRSFVQRFLPVLAERVQALGWGVTQIGATYRPFTGRRQVVERQDFEQMERLSVEA
ncbi:hypothetical protein DYH09_07470 [bacterium CPR1]|nr:hypothetical protein [bacterium CPR1]